MAESPIKITRSDDGLSVRYEFDAHYVSDEDAKRIRGYIDQLQAENAKLQEELAKWERLAAGIDLTEYPVTQFKPKDLERENAKLQDENARLRSRLSDEFAENARMTVENAKLRELVRVMAYCMQHERECDGCRLNGADGTITAPVGCDGLLDRMRELFGKENDGCDLV